MATEIFHTIEAKGIRATLDLRVGHIRRLVVERDGKSLEPLNSAPWVDDAAIIEDETLLPNLRFLSGDFFCAPFSTSDVVEAPPHGWPANSRWRVLTVEAHPEGGTIARYELERDVLGARLIKEFTLRDGHPFLYERHVFIGGSGAVPVANHAMVRLPTGGTLSFSEKRFAFTPETPLEPDPAMGRYALAYPSRFDDLSAAPLKDGGTANLTAYPFAQRHEDFVALVEAAAEGLGWAAAARTDQGDLFVSLRNVAELPLTMLWLSNGGRDYVPWNGRHVGVLGIEEGRTYAGYGHRASTHPNPLTEAGVPTALVLDPDGEVSVGNVIGAVPLPEGWGKVARVSANGGLLTIEGEGGGRIEFPFDADFLGTA
ncbi:hypothetical protein C3941_01505 [Kaistia algarum]|uniref:hypothetical protein n=1 Tax=Kaistia algarum TaxID=2083279 RepID=UPI000CE7516D|nr:hypothetical protein [Kaistia algarum]MCX5513106.1 hypothetical protein [Kaistia algarum]PPE81420.1 hypothetical protein C3941_01505 [Kaistia algarum]